MIACDAVSGNVRECLAEIIHPDIALHKKLVYVGDGKDDFVGKEWAITHIPTGYSLCTLDEVFGHTTAVSIARKFIPYLEAAPKYEGIVGNSHDAHKWAATLYNKDFMDFYDFHRSLRFFNDGWNGYVWIRNWQSINQDKWRK